MGKFQTSPTTNEQWSTLTIQIQQGRPSTVWQMEQEFKVKIQRVKLADTKLQAQIIMQLVFWVFYLSKHSLNSRILFSARWAVNCMIVDWVASWVANAMLKSYISLETPRTDQACYLACSNQL